MCVRFQMSLIRKSLIWFLGTSLFMISLLFYVDIYTSQERIEELQLKYLDGLSEVFDREVESIEDSVSALSRSKEVFDTSISLDDSVSRLFYNVKKMDDRIRGVRLVTGDEYFGDEPDDSVGSWSNGLMEHKKLSWSPIYRDRQGVWMKDVSFPVMYNGKVIGYVAYSVDITNFMDLKGTKEVVDVMMDEEVVLSSDMKRIGDRYEYETDDMRLSEVQGSSVVLMDREMVNWVSVLKENIWLYIVYLSSFALVSLLISWFSVSQLKGHIRWMDRLLSGIREGDVSDLRKGYVSRDLNELDYIEDGLYGEIVELVEKRNELVRVSDEYEGVVNEIANSKVLNRQLRGLYEDALSRLNEIKEDSIVKDDLIESLKTRRAVLSEDVMRTFSELSMVSEFGVDDVLADIRRIRFGDDIGELSTNVYEVQKRLSRMSYTLLNIVSLLNMREIEASRDMDVETYNFVRELKASISSVISDLRDVDVAYDDIFKSWRFDRSNSVIVDRVDRDIVRIKDIIESNKMAFSRIERELSVLLKEKE